MVIKLTKKAFWPQTLHKKFTMEHTWCASRVVKPTRTRNCSFSTRLLCTILVDTLEVVIRIPKCSTFVNFQEIDIA